MSGQWPVVKLGEVLHPVERSELVDSSREYRILGTRWYGQGLFEKDNKLGQEVAASRLYRVHEGDFIYNRLFAWKGSFAVVPPEFDGCYVSNEFPSFLADTSQVETPFLKWWFRRESTWLAALGLSTGATPTSRNRLKEASFLSLEIPLPPLPEQRRIVARIEELAAQIQEARTLRQQAAEEAEALLLSQIGRVFSRLETKYNPREFGSFSPHVTSGPRNWAKHYEQNGWRFYRAQDVGPAGSVLEDSKVFITPPPGEQGRTAMLQHGDLMIVITGATVGRVNVYRKGLEPGFVSQHVAICRLPQTEVEPDFALWGLRGPGGRQQLLGQRYGQGKPGLNLTNIRSLSLAFPPLPAQRRIVAELDALQAEADALKRLQSETATELDALLPSILDKAFKGEL